MTIATRAASLVVVIAFALACPAWAQDLGQDMPPNANPPNDPANPANPNPYWSALPYTDFKTLQTVDASGNSTYNAGAFPIKMLGIVLNNPGDMANSTANSQSTPFNLDPLWQVFIQTVDVSNDGDFGGVAVFAAQNYGNVPPNLTFPGGVPTPDPTASYNSSPTGWPAEVARISSNNTLKAGDLVLIEAQGGLSFGGKFNINEEHEINPNTQFNLVILPPNPSYPAITPTSLDLADIWDNSTNAVGFDPTGATGGERYQSTLVRLEDVSLAPGQSALWSANNFVTVQDSFGRQFDLELGTNSAFTPANAPTGMFDVTGIFDQEAGSTGPFTTGYDLWVMDPTTITAVPEPSSIVLGVLGVMGVLALIRSRPARPKASL